MLNKYRKFIIHLYCVLAVKTKNVKENLSGYWMFLSWPPNVYVNEYILCLCMPWHIYKLNKEKEKK